MSTFRELLEKRFLDVGLNTQHDLDIFVAGAHWGLLLAAGEGEQQLADWERSLGGLMSELGRDPKSKPREAQVSCGWLRARAQELR